MEEEKLESHPEEVSVSSSIHQVFHEKGVEDAEKDEDMLAGVKSDLVSFCRSASLGNALRTRPAENHKGNLRSR